MKFVPKTVTRFAARQTLVAKKNSPNILFGAGIIGVVGGTVLACRETLRLESVLGDFQHDVEGVKRDLHDTPEYRKDLAFAYIQGASAVVKLYAPALIVGGLSIGALTASHITLTKRNAELTATLAVLTTAFNEYRARVRAELGEEKERDLYHGLPTTAKGEYVPLDPNGRSPYTRIFDETCPDWNPNPEYNKMFLLAQQNYANTMLQARGHVFLNEVYDALGMDHTQAGAVVGWVVGHGGDNFIDFGIHEPRFINGYEASIWLDFNVDGVILDKIGH